MVSKNNHMIKRTQIAEREVPHYGLRKLGVGVVSVLLGTTMYLGANSTVANAATTSISAGNNGMPAETDNQQSSVTGSAVALHNGNVANGISQSTPAENSQVPQGSGTDVQRTTVVSNNSGDSLTSEQTNNTVQVGNVTFYGYPNNPYELKNPYIVPINKTNGKFDEIKLDEAFTQKLKSQLFAGNERYIDDYNIEYLDEDGNLVKKIDPARYSTTNIPVYFNAVSKYDASNNLIYEYQAIRNNLAKAKLNFYNGAFDITTTTDLSKFTFSNPSIDTGYWLIGSPSDEAKENNSVVYYRENLPKYIQDAYMDASNVPIKVTDKNHTVKTYYATIDNGNDQSLISSQGIQALDQIKAMYQKLGNLPRSYSVTSFSDENINNLEDKINNFLKVDVNDKNIYVTSLSDVKPQYDNISWTTNYLNILLPEYDEKGKNIPNRYAGRLLIATNAGGNDSGHDYKVRIAYLPIDEDYTGKIDNIYHIANASSGGDSGMYIVPVNQTTGQVKFVDVTDPNNPVDLKTDSLSGQVGAAMNFINAQNDLNNYLSPKGKYALADDNDDIDGSENIKARNFTSQVANNEIVIKLTHIKKYMAHSNMIVIQGHLFVEGNEDPDFGQIATDLGSGEYETNYFVNLVTGKCEKYDTDLADDINKRLANFGKDIDAHASFDKNTGILTVTYDPTKYVKANAKYTNYAWDNGPVKQTLIFDFSRTVPYVHFGNGFTDSSIPDIPANVGVIQLNGKNLPFKQVDTNPGIVLNWYLEAISQKANLKFVDQDANGFDITNPYNSPAINVSEIKTIFDANGKPASQINFDKGTVTVQGTIDALQKQGYELVSNSFDKKRALFDNDSKTDQHFVIVMKHKHQDITPDQDATNLVKVVTRKIDYKNVKGQDVNGSPTHTSNYKQDVYFVRTAVKDLVTGQVLGYDLNNDGKVDIPANFGNQAWQAATKGADGKYTVNADANKFVDVVSQTPSSLGYNNVNLPIVEGHAVSYNSPVETVHVIYSKNPEPIKEQGSIKVNYFDDTIQQPLSKVGNTELGYNTGKVDSGTDVDFDTHDAQIKALQDAGYKIIFDPTSTMPKTVGNNDLVYTIHVEHQIIPVTPDKPGNGLKHNDLTKTITETVHYVGAGDLTPADKSAHLTFNGIAYYDSVTKKWTDVNGNELKDQTKSITWTAQNGHQFAAVVTPMVDGYTSKVQEGYDDGQGNVKALTGINQNSQDINVTVTYIPVAQVEKAILHIVDITDGNKELNSFKASGKDNTAITFDGAAGNVDALTKAGYKVHSIVQATTDPQKPTKYGMDYNTAAGQWKFDNKPSVNQEFYVFLEHDYTPINPENAYGRKDLTRKVVETVHYVDEATGKPVASDYTNTLTFTGQGMVDKVTGKMLAVKSTANGKIAYDYDLKNEKNISTAKDSDFVWSTPTVLQKVMSPTIDGYTIDAAKTTPSDLADGNDIKAIENVAYSHDNVEATVYYKANPVEVHKAELTIYANGQEVGKASATGAKGTAISFENADNTVQAYLNNGYKFDHAQDVTNNQKLSGTSYDTINFGNYAATNNSDQKFAIYLTKAPAKTQQSAELIINDVTPKKAVQLGKYTQSGLEGTPISFVDTQSQLNYLLSHGYIWKDVSYNGQSLPAKGYQDIKFGNYDSVADKAGASQQWIIELVHNIKNQPMTTTSTAHVHYIMADGTKAPADSPVQTITWTKTDQVDQVTGKTVKAGTWTPDKSSFADVESPEVQNYQPNMKDVHFAAPQQGNSYVVTVIYTKNDQKPLPVDQGTIEVTVHDVTTDQDLTAYGKQSGVQKVGTEFNYDKTGTLKDLKDAGYKIINPEVTIPTTVAKNDQHVTIYVEHQIIPVTPDKPGNGLNRDDLTKTVTETIHYEGAGEQTPAAKTAKLFFNGTAYYDSVTKKWTDASGNELKDQTKNVTWIAQSGNQFATVVTPTINGYTSKVQEGYDDGQGNVKEIPGIDQNSKDIDITVAYSKAAQPTSPTQPTNKPTSPTSPTQPTNEPTSLTSPTQPTNKPTSPTSPTQPTNKPTSPTSSTQPTNKPTSPTSPTQPTNEPTSPTSPTQPTKKPTNNPTSPTQPTNKPTSPTSPTQPTSPTSPTQPTNNPTSPTSPMIKPVPQTNTLKASNCTAG